MVNDKMMKIEEIRKFLKMDEHNLSEDKDKIKFMIGEMDENLRDSPEAFDVEFVGFQNYDPQHKLIFIDKEGTFYLGNTVYLSPTLHISRLLPLKIEGLDAVKVLKRLCYYGESITLDEVIEKHNIKDVKDFGVVLWEQNEIFYYHIETSEYWSEPYLSCSKYDIGKSFNGFIKQIEKDTGVEIDG